MGVVLLECGAGPYTGVKRPAPHKERTIRIERIDSWKSFGKWAMDQIAHTLIVLAAAWPVLTFGWWGIPLSGVAVLTVREVEQWRSKSAESKFMQSLQPFWERHIDRVVDVALGTLIAWALLY